MPTRKADAKWEGDLQNGKGHMSVESGAFSSAFSFHSRFEDGEATNPEELIGAALAGCFSMALSNILAEAGHTPDRVETTADVTLEILDDGGPTITTIHLTTVGSVPGLDADAFQEFAAKAKAGCPASKALAGPNVTLDATLK
ncbi:peroxiredoxin [Longibacter salinarum]|uniref:Peroxiredoxin n=1 Tax=Longibacter salinarum TaxID=1850348 RepID=A0A2A8D2Y5_9BACT|nr:OsmC family protein [Longibacter salinarum]PEN15241.1 peroxiredoxin [Longibacter salinarum]